MSVNGKCSHCGERGRWDVTYKFLTRFYKIQSSRPFDTSRWALLLCPKCRKTIKPGSKIQYGDAAYMYGRKVSRLVSTAEELNKKIVDYCRIPREIVKEKFGIEFKVEDVADCLVFADWMDENYPAVFFNTTELRKLYKEMTS